MEVRYDDEKLSIVWEYKITKHTHKTKIDKITQHIVGLNSALVNLAKIRKIVFIYKNPLSNDKLYHMSISEPLVDEYYTVMTRNNGRQVTIQLPKELKELKQDSVQKVRIIYYPQEEDPSLKSKPLMTMEIMNVEEDEPEAKIIKGKDGAKIRWELKPHEEIPSDLKEFINEDEKERLNYNPKLNIVDLDIQTLKITITDADEREETDSEHQ